MPRERDFRLLTEPTDWWTVHRGASSIVGTAIHNGHEVLPDLERNMAISEDDRLREEDPFTEYVIRDIPNRIIFHRSRFGVDLNRQREEAVYLSPEQAWGLDIWKQRPSRGMIDPLLKIYDDYYTMLETVLGNIEEQFGRFVVLDIHSYNHRRGGADMPEDPAQSRPDINIGTFSMDRARWAHVVDPFMDALRQCSFAGRTLDVRENVAFQGKGQQTRFIHESFPKTGCAIAVEFKKVFMDEWTGRPDRDALVSMRRMIGAAVPVLESALLESA
jgi:hypothetical protein